MPLEGYQFMILPTHAVRFSGYDDLVAFISISLPSRQPTKALAK
jgi:hypothetical protein